MLSSADTLKFATSLDPDLTPSPDIVSVMMAAIVDHIFSKKIWKRLENSFELPHKKFQALFLVS